MTWRDPASGRVEYRPSRDALGSQSQTWPPIGSGVPFFGVEAKVPANWLLARGQEVKIELYQPLYDVIGTTYNTGGETAGYFRLPDLRARVPVGLDNMGGSDAGRLAVANTLGLTGGAETHTLTSSQMPSHTHTGPSHVHYIYNFAWVSNTSANVLVPASGQALGTPTSAAGTGATGSTGSGTAHNNMQPYILTNWIIRAS